MASRKPLPCTERDVGRAEVLPSRLSSKEFSAPVGPMKQPPTRQVGGLPAVTTQLDQSSSGAAAIHCCQAPRTLATEPAGNRRENTVRSGAGSVLNVNEVTMPKLPPPPPRSAQNRSGSESAEAVRSWPSAVTTRTERTRSQVRPNLRASTPMPPPR